MCPPLLKTCSCWIVQFNSLWRQRLTFVAFPCVLTQDAHRRGLRNVRRVFLRFRTVLSFRSIRGFISIGKWRLFLTIQCKNWCQEISAYKLINELFKVVFLALLAGVQNMREIMLIQWLQFRHKLLKEWLTLIQRIYRCPAIRKTDVLSFGNLDKTPIKLKTLEFDAREFSIMHRSIDIIVRFVGELKKLYFVCRCLYSLHIVKHWDFWPFLV